MSLATDIDGKYTVTSKNSYDGPHEKQSDGFTIIKGGKTLRIDGAGCQWSSRFEWVNDTTIKMTSTVDTSQAEKGFLLLDAKGKPTNADQAYDCMLAVTREHDLLTLSGKMKVGSETILLTLRQVRA